MQLFLRSDKLHCVQVDENDLVLSLVEKIQSLEGLSFEDQVLSYHGTVLEVEQTIAGAGISDLATIDILGRLHGGKVHGSLARAGKVKGQTPKVDAQEKKEKEDRSSHAQDAIQSSLCQRCTNLWQKTRTQFQLLNSLISV
uniref:Ubiquitin-like protein FUBI n=1 Tax=Phallusia mammillata TaxID=59560 RepID=A0A6F9DCI7_9ASCI|nr:ubiquitin-like protein FUBI [Phallusia mammillata]